MGVLAIQTENGKAFEYAVLISLYNELRHNQPISIQQTSALTNAKEFYQNAERGLRLDMDLAGKAATKVLLRMEPQLENPCGNIPLFLSIQEDAAGIEGDVRDILTIRDQNNWEIGISCKHNHSAVKHSRLSPTIDFGRTWFGIPCSRFYFDAISPLFFELNRMRENNVMWSEVDEKEERFYKPLLAAFIEELKRLDSSNTGIIPRRLLSYLLGINDFYKIIADDRSRLTQIQAFNLNGTLNRNAGSVRPQVRIPQLGLPDRFHDISFKPGSRNTVQIVCNEGWCISMRIHNASSRVEPSLKFDVTLTGIPPSLYTHFEPW